MNTGEIKSKFLELTKPSVLSANYRLGNYKKAVWLIGSGRSGTTWVSDMLNYKRGYREVLEPFRPHVIQESRFLSINEYVRPGTKNDEIIAYYKRVFNGSFQHIDVDSAANKLRYHGILVKDVFANLFAKHVFDSNPNTKVILLIRNPFEVALSMQKLNNWVWMTNPLLFLNQPELMEDHLSPFGDLIKQVGENGSLLERLILIWCVINYVPLRQFNTSEMHVSFYEDVKENPSREVDKMWHFIQGSEKTNTIKIPDIIAKKSSSVSRDLGKSVQNEKKSWHEKLSAAQIEAGQNILMAFGFQNLYSSAGKPNHERLKSIFNSQQ